MTANCCPNTYARKITREEHKDARQLARTGAVLSQRTDLMDPALGMFIQPDCFEVTEPRGGTNSYDPELSDYLHRLTAAERDKLYPGAVWSDKETRLQAGAYKNSKTGGIIVVFSGTQDLQDWKNNGVQGMLGDSPKYTQAKGIAAYVSGKTQGPLSFSGHSLGGGLAMEAANALPASIRRVNPHRDAKTFNATGVRDTIQEITNNVWMGMIGRNTKMKNHVVLGDPVSSLNAVTLGMGIFGFLTYYSPISWNPLSNHQMAAFRGRIAGYHD
ncbi:DUF2974 domain-containing protein [Tropicibacter alexandrii]|uniref:DUF2974 domain-containing protein n=1 Tax=Tropicibacter alexandrii TaxID=2267683 RepID=UPI0013E8F524|nr:DUF2974 domain-containing protein [Tropicibacter alexandrii]